ncbi:MAG: tetratricopeptide repeat protein [Phycisphaerales bacterium]|nr:MAG: tetratricopeptide repeat protein [Phycisphaerales bacterium]
MAVEDLSNRSERSFGADHCAQAVHFCQTRSYGGDTRFPAFHQASGGRQLKLGNDHPDTLESKNDLAVLYKEQAEYQEAEDLLLEALEGRRLRLGGTHPHTLESWNNLIGLYEAWNKPEKAKEWRAKLLETEAVVQ